MRKLGIPERKVRDRGGALHLVGTKIRIGEEVTWHSEPLVLGFQNGQGKTDTSAKSSPFLCGVPPPASLSFLFCSLYLPSSGTWKLPFISPLFS
jgi:hypothetical protein